MTKKADPVAQMHQWSKGLRTQLPAPDTRGRGSADVSDNWSLDPEAYGQKALARVISRLKSREAPLREGGKFVEALESLAAQPLSPNADSLSEAIERLRGLAQIRKGLAAYELAQEMWEDFRIAVAAAIEQNQEERQQRDGKRRAN